MLEGLRATTPAEAAAFALGLAYSLLAVRRNRWCWLAGGLGSAILAFLAARALLPMQAALQIYYVAMAVYGFHRWTKQQKTSLQPVSLWPLRYHFVGLSVVLGISLLSARWLAAETQAAWPFLDSLTTWASLLATWMAAHTKLENWLYWIVIDSILTFLFAAQGLYFIALLFAIYLAVALMGFRTWLQAFRQPVQTD